MYGLLFTLVSCGERGVLPVGEIDVPPLDSAGEEEPSPVQNLLILSLDTVRWDQATGSDAMPYLAERTATAGVLLSSLWTTGNWTQPTMPVVQTGVYGFEMGTSLYEPGQPLLSPAFPTLAERLGTVGYATYMDTCNKVFDLTEATRGFQTIFVCDVPSAMQQFERAEAWIEASRVSDPDAPWMVQIHMNDAHGPFTRPHDSCAASTEALAALCPYDTVNIEMLQDVAPEHQVACEAAVNAQHDCSARMMDQVLDISLGRWEQAGLLSNAAVLVVTDHGENYYQDNGTWPDEGEAMARVMSHRRGMNAQVSRGFGWVWVPALSEPTTISAATSQVDIVPTALHLLGRDDLATGMDGTSVFSLPPDRVVTQFSCDSASYRWHGASDARYHMIVYHDMELATERWAMYDILADPQETSPMPVEGGPRPLVDALRAQLVRSSGEDAYCGYVP